ncbi:beta-lactamase family protein [Nocardiopsis exhalans]|uniref:Beta-lactamase family protein n=1 Tax=Nocardiopsis exhalans TaxID=163604 RepID=A0ABY5D6Y2_9ACTN|nr:serine hydrolase domain-containing protein [Nocardiopsis exhalans]USY18942.1 beta-lactamase family protein [Nocardiopsis exhalans]
MTSPDAQHLPPNRDQPDSGQPDSGRLAIERSGKRPRAAAAPRGALLSALGVGAVVTLAAVLLFPLLPHRAPVAAVEFEGDEALVTDVSAALDSTNVQGLAVARFDNHAPDQVEWVTAGTADGTAPITTDTPFETGSVFKVFTAMTLADMAADGQTSLDRTLGEIFPDTEFADPAFAEATLEDLATHHAGFVTQLEEGPLGALRRNAWGDSYRQAVPPLEFAATTQAAAPGSFMYSNAGYALLGEALAEESGIPYPELVRERVLDPLGLDATVISDAGVPEGGAGPYTEPGSRVQDWRNTDYAAAGVATWGTPEDLVRFMAALAEGEAPGMAALEPVHETVELAIANSEPEGLGTALGWRLLDVPDVGQVTWHSGGSFGTRTMVATDGEQSVVVMANSFGVEAPALAFQLLGDDPQRIPGSPVPVKPLVTYFTALVPAALLLALVLRHRTLVTQRPLDRLRIVSLTLGALAWNLLGLRHGDWVGTPAFVWALGLGLIAAAVTVGAWYWRRVPVEAGRFRWLHVTVFVLSLLFSLSLGSLMGWGIAVAWS